MVSKYGKIRKVILMLLVVLMVEGCTFYFLKGNGPKLRAMYTKYLPDESIEQVDRWKEESFKPYLFFGSLSPKGYGPLSDYIIHYYPTPFFPILAGPDRKVMFCEPNEANKEVKRPLVKHDNGWGFLFPLFYTAKSFSYDCNTGECLSAERVTCVTAVMFFHSFTKPTGGVIWFLPSDAFDNSKEVRDLQYDRMTSWSLGWGALATGTKTGRAYLQIVWIPIPLWSID